MLMALGRIIYYNEASQAVDYFTSINYKSPDFMNPADFFMGIMSIESLLEEDDEDEKEKTLSREEIYENYRERIAYFDKCYQESALKNDHKAMHPEARPFNDNDDTNNQMPWFY
jgi:hypothetical protein